MRTDWEVERSVTEAERVVIVRDLSLAISSAFTVETEMITTFTDSERHRQDSNAQMLPDNLDKPQGALTNPKGDQEPKLSLVDTEPGRTCMKMLSDRQLHQQERVKRRFQRHVKYAAEY